MSVLAEAFEKPQKNKEIKSVLGTFFALPSVFKEYKNDSLSVPVQLKGSGLEKRRLTHLVNTLAQSPLGKMQLENAAKEGYTIAFEYMDGAYGSCGCDKEKCIALNPVFSDKTLISTLAHESRHALQYSRGLPPNFLQYDIATEAKMWRAAEADAEASAAFCSLEIGAATGDTSVWKGFANRNYKTGKAMAAVLFGDESLDRLQEKQPEIMRTAFKNWYEDSMIVDIYENGYLYSRLSDSLDRSAAKRAEDYEKYPLDKSLTSAEIVQKYCRVSNGECYFKDNPDVLDGNTEMNGITEETRRAADRFFKLREKETGKAPDTSYKNLPSRFHLSGLSLIDYQMNEPEQTTAFQLACRRRLRDRG